jgi:hypothetical protein
MTPENSSGPILRNPLVLGLIGLAASFVLSALVILMVVHAGGGAASQPGAPVIETVASSNKSGLVARSIAAAAIRDGPGPDYRSVSELPGDKDVEVIGRNPDASWFSVFYPPGSQVTGWVPKTALDFTGSPAVLPVTSISPSPTATSTPTPTTSSATPEATATLTATTTPTVTPTVAAAFHLVVSIVAGSCRPGQHLLISVGNTGPAALENRDLQLSVQSQQGEQIFLGSLTATIKPREAMTIDTTYVVQQPALAIVDPNQTLGDANVQDHRVDCVPAAAPPTR